MREHRPGLRGKKNAIISLYRHPPPRGQVVCFDEMGPLQTIPRGGRSWGTRPARRPDRYEREGTLQWLCAFCPTTGQAVGHGHQRKTGDDCRAFWQDHLFPTWPHGSIHLVMDNLSAHRKALRELPVRLARRIRVYWLPTNSSWLNLIESYFATLSLTALHNTDYREVEDMENGLRAGVCYLNAHPTQYIWKKI